jgi:pimeloyl-ACP methyl ester carboxylesterase
MKLPACEFVAIRGKRVRFRTLGHVAHPAVVFCHGYPDTLRVFEPLAEQLGRTHRTVLFDWPGQGQSEAAGVHTPADRARFVQELAEALGLSSFALFGHDMGALPVLASRGRRAIVANALLDHRGPVSAEIRLLRVGQLYRFVMRGAADLVFRRCIGSFLRSGHALSAAALEEMRRDFSATIAETIAVCQAYDRSLPGFLDRLEPGEGNIVALWGSTGRHFPVAHARALEARVPGVVIQEVPRGSHWMVAQAPVTMAESIRGALGRP